MKAFRKRAAVDLLREVHEHAVDGDIAWLKTKGDRYVKIVEWSDEDNCFIGSCPELLYGGCHGNDAKQVFAELCELVEEAIETLEQAGKPLPQPLSRSEFGSLMQRSA